jgi:hypothetical protein
MTMCECNRISLLVECSLPSLYSWA